jgi:hypothetical protein
MRQDSLVTFFNNFVKTIHKYLWYSVSRVEFVFLKDRSIFQVGWEIMTLWDNIWNLSTKKVTFEILTYDLFELIYFWVYANKFI